MKKAERGSVKVAQKVVHGDDKLTKIKELKELHDAGVIDDDEFKQMKTEILGK